MISSSFAPISDPNYGILYAPFYDAVPFGTPTVTESTPGGNGVDPTVTVTIGNTLTVNVAAISDYDGIAAGTMKYQWQYLDVITGNWINYTGATSASFVVPQFLKGMLGVRAEVTYVDGKGYTERLFSASTTTVTVGAGNTPPRVVAQQQFNGIADTSALGGPSVRLLLPVRRDLYRRPDRIQCLDLLRDPSEWTTSVDRKSFVHFRS